MLQTLKSWDESFFLLLNSMHHYGVDEFMVFVSHNYAWIPLYAYLIYLIIKKYKVKSLYVLIAIALLITISDRFTSGFMKPYFHRLRPCHETHLQQIIHTVNGCGGQYGFASSHAANAFAVATFVFLLFGMDKKWGCFLFAWAILVSYSRIYLGAHYPGDILVGAIVGAFFAIIIFRLLNLLTRKFSSTPLYGTQHSLSIRE